MQQKQDRGELSKPARQDPVVLEQATAVAALLPALIRQMFTDDHEAVSELPLAQLRVCAILYQQPRSMSALSRELGITLSAITQLADRLERVGLVERIAEGSDRRVRQLRLTERGEVLMRNHREVRIRCVLRVFQHLSPAARQEILGALETLMHACDATKPDPPSPQGGDGPSSVFPTVKAIP